MRIFAIRDDELECRKNLAYLIYYEKSKRFYIEIPDNADLWETPLLLSELFRQGYHTIDAYWSKLWVQQRIVPPDRQNIGQILKANGLEEYDEFQLLLLGNGRCAQDNYYLEELPEEELPAKMAKRFLKRVYNVIPLEEESLLVFFQDGRIRKMTLKSVLTGKEQRYLEVLRKQEVFTTVKVQPGGYGICWGEQVNIASEVLYTRGQLIPLSQNDFLNFVKYQVVNTSEAVDILSCSRQNINDLVLRKKLYPVKKTAKNTLFMKRDLEQRTWL